MSIKSFPVSDQLRIDAWPNGPVLFIYEEEGERPADSRYIIVELKEVKDLIAQLGEAMLYLVGEHENIQDQ